jgi:chromate transporter
VERWHWLSEQQLLDAFAVGQVTPGPLFTTATFIGFILAGPVGAIDATVGIFHPAFFWVAAGGRIIDRLCRSAPARSVLDGLNVASWALMSVVALQLAARVEWTAFPVVILAGSAWALFRWRVPSIWPMVAAGSLGWIAGTFGWI